MLIADINPFIRFAKHIFLKNRGTYCIAKDCRIFFIEDESGEGVVNIGSKSHSFNKNSLIFIAANTPYKFTISKPVKAMTINFDFTQYRSSELLPFEIQFINNLSGYLKPKQKKIFEDKVFLNDAVVLEDASFLLVSINKILKEYEDNNEYFREAASSLLKLLLINIIKEKEKTALYTNPYYIKNLAPVQRVKSYIHEHYKENLTNDIIARFVDYHSYHLNRIFKKIEGISIHRYLNNYRIAVAENLLIETDLSITFIAAEVGFENTTSFTQNFKARNNTTPLKYRNLHRKIF